MYFRYFVIISPWKRAGPSIWIPFNQGCFVLSLVKIGQVFFEKNIKMWKVNDNYNDENDGDNDNDDN